MKIVTHSGSFHADDVFAVAVLTLKFPDAEVIRSRDPQVIENADIAVDVGKIHDPSKKRFDHHQEGGAGLHPNGIPYASFGLVWKEYGESVSGGKEVAELIADKLVSPIDALDNGVLVCIPVFEEKQVREYSIRDFFYSFLEYGDMSEDYLHEVFMKVVEIARGILTRESKKMQEKIDGLKKVKEIFENSADKRVIVLDEPLAWNEVLIPAQEPLYVVYPRREGNWGVKAIPVGLEDFKVKKMLPESWAGKEGEELIQISGVEDAKFCHNGRFVAAAKSKEGAIALAQIAANA